MAAFTIDNERMMTQTTLDMSKPANSPQGLPVTQIALAEFPRVVYKHPAQPWKKVEHRNAQREVVQVETVATEALACTVRNKDEMAQKLKEGWVTEPYVQRAPPDPDAALYEPPAGSPGAGKIRAA